MKTHVFILVLFLPVFSFGQYQYNFLKEYFFGRQPSTRAESMGRAYASVDGDLTAACFNPAGAATIRGVVANGSYATPYYLWNKATYQYLNVGYKVKDYLILGLSRNHFNSGENIYVYDGNGFFANYSPNQTTYTLTVASQPIKNLMFGLNTNYFIVQQPQKKIATVSCDFGVIKKFEFAKRESSEQSVNLGAGITNFTNSGITSEYAGNSYTDDLPIITRFGANYQICLDKHWLTDHLKTLKVLVQAEYQDLLNCDYETGIRGGAEVTLLEVLSIRAGYYSEKQYDYGYLSNYRQIGAFTYGLGLQLPLHAWTKIPVNISFDYTSMEQPPYSDDYANPSDFTSYSLRLNWIF